MNLRYKFLVTVLSIVLIPLFFVSLLNFSNARQLLTEQTLSKLSTSRDFKVEQIEKGIEDDIENLHLLENRLQIQGLLANYNRSKSPQDLNKINEILTDAKTEVADFQAIHILSVDGQVVASTNSTIIGQDKSQDRFFLQGIKADSANVFLRNQDNQLSHYWSGPLLVGDKTIGVLVVQTNASNETSIVTNYLGLGSTEEFLLAIREGDRGVFTHPLKFDKDAAFNRKIDLDGSTPMALALVGKNGVFTDIKDYRGVSVLAATYYFKDLDAGLVVKMDKSEAFSSISNLQTSLFIITFSVLVFTLLAVFSLARTFTEPIIKLSEVANKFAIGDFTTVTTIVTTRKDELGTLIRALNTMAIKIKESHDTLEGRVQERTDELEKVNKLMMGRELKMIDLKKEIASLKKVK
ncbi:MAG TPA: HAMP domain-containing protein [Patescibacteria group bacterium]|nr:HAMP domain-containing protein [Patescibacteria group bacterium]